MDKKIGLITDSSSGLAFAPFKHDVKIARSTIQFGGDTLLDGRDITTDEFFQRLEQTLEVPTTAAPSTGEIVSQIEAHKKEGKDTIIYFPISSGLSTYGLNLKQLIDSLELGVDFYVFDAKTACLMQGLVVRYAQVLVDKGYGVQDIIDQCAIMIKQIDSYFVVDDLKYLIRNGRLGRMSGTIGTLANIKPILVLNHEGIIVPFEKVRTQKKAIRHIKDIIEHESKKYQKKLFMVVHTNRLTQAQELREEIKMEFTEDAPVLISVIVSTVGAHVGSGVLGIVCMGLDDLKEDLLENLN